jgi:hypothetical protein
VLILRFIICYFVGKEFNNWNLLSLRLENFTDELSLDRHFSAEAISAFK